MFCLLALLAIASAPAAARVQFELLDYDPVADPAAVVTVGAARFTVLTDAVVRMEWDEQLKWEDRATLAVVQRRLPVPHFTKADTNNGTGVDIDTALLSVRYSGGLFSADSLQATIKATGATWRFGQEVDASNLLGTIRSLDEEGVIPLNCTLNAGIRVHDESLHCQWGLISRIGGWAVINDTANWGLDSESQWWSSPNVDNTDWYLFGHGSNYTGALKDYTQLGGRIAMPPRQSLGIWWSRWFNLDNRGVRGVVNDYASRGLPLDVYVLDMDWHTKDSWGGYTFDKALFPVPEHTMGWLTEQGLLTALNLHDDTGMMTDEATFREFATALGLPSTFNATIPFDIANSTYALNLEDIVLKALQDQHGLDVPWIDWQQGGTQGGCKGGAMNPTIWLSRLRATDHIRRNESQRGAVLARFGGMGNHRYQVGFSGDVAGLTWKNLAFQPYFSWTASNVLFGFWSHDIVGPPSGPWANFELYTRWIQWGSMSSVFRTHDRGMASGSCAQSFPSQCSITEMWNVPPQFFDANRAAVQWRHQMLPYLYTAQREAFDTGISLMRPLYYTYPDLDNAYLGEGTVGDFAQYMLGPDMMAAPVVHPAPTGQLTSCHTVWMPPGLWFDEEYGMVVEGGPSVMLTRNVDISERPRWLRVGAIVPRIPLEIGATIGRAAQQYAALDLHLVIPTQKVRTTLSNSTMLYEDDGATTDYAYSDAFCRTKMDLELTTADELSLKVGAGCAEGQSYPSRPPTRSYAVRFSSGPPVSCKINGGAAVPFSRSGGANTWSYDADRVEVVVETGAVSTDAPLTIDCQLDSLWWTVFGARGAIRRAQLAKETLDVSWSTPGSQTVEAAPLSELASMGEHLAWLAGTDPKGFYSLLKEIPVLRSKAMESLDKIKPSAARETAPTMQQWQAAFKLVAQESC